MACSFLSGKDRAPNIVNLAADFIVPSPVFLNTFKVFPDLKFDDCYIGQCHCLSVTAHSSWLLSCSPSFCQITISYTGVPFSSLFYDWDCWGYLINTLIREKNFVVPFAPLIGGELTRKIYFQLWLASRHWIEELGTYYESRFRVLESKYESHTDVLIR